MLVEAVVEGDVELVREALAEGLSPEGEDPETSPLLQALWRSSEPLVRLLLEAPGAAPAFGRKREVTAGRAPRSVPDPEPHRLAGQTVWVFGSPEGPSLAWHWKWGVVTQGKVRWQPTFDAAHLKLSERRIRKPRSGGAL